MEPIQNFEIQGIRVLKVSHLSFVCKEKMLDHGQTCTPQGQRDWFSSIHSRRSMVHCACNKTEGVGLLCKKPGLSAKLYIMQD